MDSSVSEYSPTEEVLAMSVWSREAMGKFKKDLERFPLCETLEKEWGQRPTMPERLLDNYLRKEFPGRYIYSGDNSQGEYLRSIGYTGLGIPDWVNIKGEKEVISEMGGLGYSTSYKMKERK